MPVQEKAEGKKGEESRDFKDSPKGIGRISPRNFAINRFGVVPEIAQKNVAPDALRFAVMTVPVNGKPVDGFSMLVGLVAVTHVMPLMNIFVEGLRKTHRQRFDQAEHPIQKMGSKIGIVEKIVGDAVDVPRNADRIGKPHADEHPPGSEGKNGKEREHKCKMRQPGKNRNDVPFRISEEFHG